MTRTRRSDNPKAPKALLAEVRAFITAVRDALGGPHTDEQGMWFSRRGDGSIHLERSETLHYSRTVALLANSTAADGLMSRAVVQKILQDAVFDSLDPQSRQGQPFEARLEQALATMATRLSDPAAHFTCWVEVAGMDNACLPARFGGVRFRRFGTADLPSVKPNTSAGQRSVRGELRSGSLWGRPCAVVTVLAKDFEAARALAEDRTRAVLDQINAFSDLIPYNAGWLYLPGDASSALRVSPVRRENDSATGLGYSRVDPLGYFAWTTLRAQKRLHRMFRYLSSASQSSTRGTVGSLMASAAQWIGRATVDRRREESFLLLTIALETMLLPGTKSGELSFRLKVRCAHLLGRTPAARTRIAKEAARMYDLRSSIVHSGHTGVPEDDLALVRTLALRTLLALLSRPSLRNMNYQEFTEWLDRRLHHK